MNKVLSAPFSVCFAVTGKCNLKCRHCGAKDTWGARDIAKSKIFEIIDQIGKAKVFDVSLFGGEPLVRKDLFDLIGRFKKYPIQLSMNTNAVLMTSKTAEILVKKLGVNNYIVSIDGNKETHEMQRGRNSFDKAIAGIRNILKSGGKVIISFTVTKINISDIEDVIRIGKRLGVSQVRFNHVFYGGNAACYMKEVYVSPQEERAAFNLIHVFSKRYPGFLTGSYVQQYDKFKALGKIKPKKQLIVEPCGAAITRCAIRPDGWMVPCEVIWEVKAGNAKNKDFLDIWNNSPVMKKFRKPLHIDCMKLGECAGCDYQFICFSGHRCYPYHYPGGIRNKQLYCWQRSS